MDSQKMISPLQARFVVVPGPAKKQPVWLMASCGKNRSTFPALISLGDNIFTG